MRKPFSTDLDGKHLRAHQRTEPRTQRSGRLAARDQAMASPKAMPCQSRFEALHSLPGTQGCRRCERLRHDVGVSRFAGKVESKDDELARRMREAGAIFIGHSNMPEFGLGSHTFNELYGGTFNPFDLSKTPGRQRQRCVALAADCCLWQMAAI